MFQKKICQTYYSQTCHKARRNQRDKEVFSRFVCTALDPRSYTVSSATCTQNPAYKGQIQMHMDVVEEGWSSDDLAIRGSKEEEVEDRPVPSRSRASRKPKEGRPRGGSKRKLTCKTKAEILKRKSRKTWVIENTDEHEDAPLVNVSATKEGEIDPVRPQSCTSKGRRHAVTMPPSPSAPPAESVNPLIEGDKIVSTCRSLSHIKAKSIP